VRWRNVGERRCSRGDGYSLQFLAQQDQGRTWVLTEGSGGRSSSAGQSATRTGSGAGRSSRTGSMQGSSGPLDSTGNFGIELRSRWRGQGGRRCARGDGGRRRSTGGIEEQWRIGRKKATVLYPWPRVPGQKFSRYLCRP